MNCSSKTWLCECFLALFMCSIVLQEGNTIHQLPPAKLKHCTHLPAALVKGYAVPARMCSWLFVLFLVVVVVAVLLLVQVVPLAAGLNVMRCHAIFALDRHRLCQLRAVQVQLVLGSLYGSTLSLWTADSWMCCRMKESSWKCYKNAK